MRQLKGKPRNKPGKIEADELRDHVRSLVRLLRCTCPHCRKPPTGKRVLKLLPSKFENRDVRTINTHIREVVAELDQQIDDRSGSLFID